MSVKFHITGTYIKDTGLVIVLVLLLVAYWRGEESLFIPLAIAILVLVLTIPVVLKPVAMIWYYFSVGLGHVSSRIVLAVIFWGVLLPVGLVRRWMGFDPMQRKVWKKGAQSVFTKRNHLFTGDDLRRPY
jgi:hypothetical protein